jgi:hypothetical protein
VAREAATRRHRTMGPLAGAAAAVGIQEKKRGATFGGGKDGGKKNRIRGIQWGCASSLQLMR